jgi:hypothetical protein
MSALSNLREMAMSVRLVDGKIAMRGANQAAIAYAQEHREEILEELRSEPVWPPHVSRGDMAAVCRLERRKLVPFLHDDRARRAHEMLASFELAILDNELHGRRWFARHGLELKRLLAITKHDPVLEGAELQRCAESVFGQAWQGLPRATPCVAGNPMEGGLF